MSSAVQEIGRNGSSPAGANDVVRVSGLRKSYGEQEAVRGVDFSIPKGTAFGYLWPVLPWTGVGLFVAVRRFRVEMTAAGGDARRPATA